MSTADRTYWHRIDAQTAWHALDVDGDGRHRYVGYCGRAQNQNVEMADRVPRDGHLCGSCSRSIAARTDYEGEP